jgi:nucleoside-diphosphate-sugar epimerase
MHEPPLHQNERNFSGTVFVTGAAGHVGANLLHRLLTDGRDVRVLLREGDNNEAVDAVEQATGRRAARVWGDLRDPGGLRRGLDGCETAFHVAAKVSTVSGDAADLRDLFECNVLGTANVLRAAREVGVKRVVVTGSFSAVGYDESDPSKPSDETMAFSTFEPHMPYGRTKMQVEHECLKAVAEGQDVVIATSCAVLGPWDYVPSRMGRTLCDFANGRLGAYIPGGFEFVAVRDLVEGHLLALRRGRTGQRYILSTEFATVDDLMEIFEEVSGRRRPKLRLPAPVMAGIAEVSSFVLTRFFPKVPQRFTPGAVRVLRMQRHADITKAKTELGYAPTSIRAAIREAYDDFARRGLVPARSSVQGSREAEKGAHA